MLDLQGDAAVLTQAAKVLPKNGEQASAIDSSLSQLLAVVDHLQRNHPQVNVHIDLADVFGYRYHTGLKFFAYTDGRGRAIAKGGRYDRIGQQFGRARPATGFSADLKSLVKLG